MPVQIRAALPRDVPAIEALARPYSDERILVAKERVAYYEAIQEFIVAELDDRVVGCGALHVMWSDLAEVRTLAVDRSHLGRGIGHAMLDALLDRARGLGVSRIFCLTFEVDFFGRHGFVAVEGAVVGPEIYTQLLRSSDDGVAEFLDLARVKPNTLGNTRMLLTV
jgi:amino-acid N-acetyltransferase